MTMLLDFIPTGFGPGRSLFDRFFEDWSHPFITLEACEDWMPASDIAETDKEYLITMEIPGVDMTKSDISYMEGLLTIKGEKHKESKEGECCHCSERYAGSFERSFRIPGKVDADKTDATYKDGILHLTLPKSEESGVKKIEIH